MKTRPGSWCPVRLPLALVLTLVTSCCSSALAEGPPVATSIPEPLRVRMEAVGSLGDGALWFDLGVALGRWGASDAAAYALARAGRSAPAEDELTRWKTRYEAEKASIEARRPGVDDAVAAMKATPEIQELAQAAEAAQATYEEARAAYEARAKEVAEYQEIVNEAERVSREDPSEENKATAAEAAEAFNALVPEMNALAEAANGAAEHSGMATKDYAQALAEAARASTAAFDAAVLQLNALVDRIHAAEARDALLVRVLDPRPVCGAQVQELEAAEGGEPEAGAEDPAGAEEAGEPEEPKAPLAAAADLLTGGESACEAPPRE